MSQLVTSQLVMVYPSTII